MKTNSFFLFLILISFSASAQTPTPPRLVVPIGHTAPVISVAFSPDGKYVLTGSEDYTVKLWTRAGQEIQSFERQGCKVATFSPDGKYVLTGADTTATLWDLQGNKIRSFTGKQTVNHVAFASGGKLIVLGRKQLEVFYLNGNPVPNFKPPVFGVIAMAVSPAGNVIAVADQTKSVKLVDLTGKIRLTCPTQKHEINAVAFSPDGKTVVAGGLLVPITVWNCSTGQEIHSFPINLIKSLAFSPDGKYILSGSLTATLLNLQGKNQQNFYKKDATSQAIAFSPDGKAVLTGNSDGSATLWSLSGKELTTYKGHSSPVHTVAFSPDQSFIFTGTAANQARIWERSSRLVHAFPAGTEDWPTAFSPDGQYILTAGPDPEIAQLWDRSGQKIRSFSGHSRRINAVAFAPDGKSVLTGSNDNTAKRWNLDGRELQSFKTKDNVLAVHFSADGSQVLTANSDNRLQTWNLAGAQIQSFEGKFKNAASIAFSPDGKSVLTGGNEAMFQAKKDRLAILWDLSGKELQSLQGHQTDVNTAVFSPDGKFLLTASNDHTARLWDLNGKVLQTFRTTSTVTSVAYSPDGKYVLTGGKDNTTKIWDLQGKELASLVAIDSFDWVITTPSGLYDASPGAMKLMYYIQGRNIIDLEQLKERYFEPGLLYRIMGSHSENLRQVEMLGDLALYPEVTAEISNNQLNVKLLPQNGGIGKVCIFINGKEVLSDANPQRLTSLSIDLTPFRKYLLPDSNIVSIRAYNQANWLPGPASERTYSVPGTRRELPQLYIIAIGTSDYNGANLDLHFPDHDAMAMASALEQAGGQLFGKGVHKWLLSTAGKSPTELPVKANIERAFQEIAARAKAADVLVVYFSGHGTTHTVAGKNQFYYLTRDIPSAELSDPTMLETAAVSSDDLARWLTSIPALKQVMILDACSAGKLVEDLAAGQKAPNATEILALDRMKDRTGMFILTGSAADKVSYEASQYGQGLLTYSLLQGMSGLALTPDKRVDVMTLFQYSRDEVPELAKGIGGVQTPVLAFPTGGSSFDIGIVNAGVKISVTEVKPVFIRNNFQPDDPNEFDDALGLTAALADYLRGVTAKGAQAQIIYVDVAEYEGAWSMKGRYTIKGEEVTVRGKLYKDKQPKGDFQVTGKKGDLPGLVAQMVAQVSVMISKVK